MDSNKYSLKERYAIVAMLLMIMEADGVIHPAEVAFIDRIFACFNMTSDDLEIIRQYDFKHCVNVIKAIEPEARAEARDLFVKMAGCDGYAHPKELELIDSLGFK